MHDRTCSTPGCGKPTRSKSATVCTTCQSRKLKGQPLQPGSVECRQCSEAFMPKRLGMKYCSAECSYRYRKTLEAKRNKARLSLTRVTHCLHCGVDITHRTNKAKCCSKTCYDLWHKVEHHDRIIAHKRAMYHTDVEAARERTRQYVARHPERSAAAKLAYRLRNVDALRERAKANRKKSDPDGSKARLREQNRRARKLGNPESVGVSAQDWERLVDRYRGCCAYCGERPAKLTLDHVVPLAKGGRHAIGNVVPACGPCNFSKHAKFLAVWRYRYLPLVRKVAA